MTPDESRKKAMEAAYQAFMEGHGLASLSVWDHLDSAIGAYESSQLEDGRKMTPREPSRTMNEALKNYDVCAPQWRLMWDAAR